MTTNNPKYETHFHGPAYGIVIGDNNTVTIMLPNGEQLIVPFLAPPAPPYQLVGRDEMLAQLKESLFAGGSLALSALNGLPGVGKTALAVALAHDREILTHFRDGVLWAGLGREGDAFALLGSWAANLGMSSDGIAKLTTISERAKAIRQQIGTRHMLLVVDDAWQSEAALAFKIGGPNCAHLVTTRLPEVAIYFAGEGVAVVHELNEEDSLALLARIAPDVVKAEPEAARELVQAVGGLPLGLILMGNYLRVKAVGGQSRRIKRALEQLHQTEERLQVSQPQSPLEEHPSLPSASISLQAVIAVSDEALDEASRRTLRAFSVFPPKPNTFSEEAALAVAAQPIETLDTLIDYGLLEGGGPSRYTLHQTIADYAGVHRRDEATFERMVTYFVDYVEAHERDYDVLDPETSNVLTALDVASKQGMQNELVQGTNAFHGFLEGRGLYDLTEALLSRAELTASSLGDTVGQAKALRNRAKIMLRKGLLEEALQLVQQASNVLTDDEIVMKGNLFLHQSHIHLLRGENQRALQSVQRAEKIFSVKGEDRYIAAAFNLYGLIYRNISEYDKAIEHFGQSLVLFQKIDGAISCATVHNNLGFTFWARGRYQSALKHLHSCLQVAEEIGHQRIIATAYGNLGLTYMDLGDFDNALSCLKKQVQISQEIGDQREYGRGSGNLGILSYHLGLFNDALQYLDVDRKNLLSSGIEASETLAYNSVYRGLAYYELDQKDEAAAQIQEALQISKQVKSQTVEILALRGMAKIVPSKSKAYLEQALNLATQIRKELDIGICKFEMALLFEQTDRKEYQVFLTEAQNIFVKLGSKSWAEKTIKALKELELKDN